MSQMTRWKLIFFCCCSDKKPTSNEDITYGRKKHRDGYRKKNVWFLSFLTLKTDDFYNM